MYIVNTFIGFALAQILDVLRRDKDSQASPKKFKILFFWKDNKQKILLSITLSVLMTLALKLNWTEFVGLIGKEWELNNLVFLAVGFAPELLLQKLKKKYGFLQPEKVEGFERK